MTKNNIILILAAVAVTICAGGFLWYGNYLHKNLAPVVLDDHSDLIQVTSPISNEKITSPVTITGIARGSWYFEASFPVNVVDSDGKIIGQGVAQAQGDWMTTDFVPFKAEITFETKKVLGSYSHKGMLILKKDNPSGLPEHDDSIEIPVTF